MVRGKADDELLRKTSVSIKEVIEHLNGISDVDTSDLRDPEIHVDFDLQKLQAYGITATDLAQTISANFRDVVALAGIAVNAAIVMIDAANNRLNSGMSVTHSTIYAARRRVIPIIITSLITIAGLFSLATGLGGHSLICGPVAASIVWGLTFSTILTLLVVPLLYRTFMRKKPAT